mmetsp:Transcript_30652/g.35236  ORF Transcript_30652/g.35236 Transcript_30652/m.35236 type:complete len:198 (+) Transcript_30652:187-780(+)
MRPISVTAHSHSRSRRKMKTTATAVITMTNRSVLIAIFSSFIIFGFVDSFQNSILPTTSRMRTISFEVVTEGNESAEKITEKYGLEVGLVEAAKKGDGESAKSLLKKYGIAYLATSIPLAIVSFTLCYVLVDNGVDVGSLLAKVGIENSGAVDKAGTVAISYAAHKAASPIRFPPTVLLTPVVAKMIGREPEEEEVE